MLLGVSPCLAVDIIALFVKWDDGVGPRRLADARGAALATLTNQKPLAEDADSSARASRDRRRISPRCSESFPPPSAYPQPTHTPSTPYRSPPLEMHPTQKRPCQKVPLVWPELHRGA